MCKTFTSLALCFAAQILPAQTIAWRFTETPSYGCPSQIGYPLIDQSQQHYPVTAWSTASITWRNFDSNQPIVLLLSFSAPMPVWPPCISAQPDLVLVATTTQQGYGRFMWLLPVTAPLSVVPLGITPLGSGQAVQLDWSGLIPTASSPPFIIESMR